MGADAAPTPLNDGGFIGMLEARAISFGAMAGARYGEPLHIDGPLLLQDLPEWSAHSRPHTAYRGQL
jgi:hypothetical protein